MHILIIPSERYVPREEPLSGIFQRDQAHALRRAGYKVGVISSPHLRSLRLLRKGLSGWPTRIHIEDDQGMPVYRYFGWNLIPRIPQAHIWLWLRAGMTLFRTYISQHGKPEIIHAHNARFAGLLASRIKREWHIPYVLTEHSSAYVRKQIRSSEMAYLKDTFENADERLMVSPSLGHVLETVLGDSVRPWDWVPNIIGGRFEKNPPRKAERQRKKMFRFLTVGSLIEIKGHADLLRAFASAFSGRSDVQLRIGGHGNLSKELEALSHELGIGEQVIFLGQLSREQVLAEMQACDTFVLSSHYETFGVVLIEALSCGKSVIATACGGPECIVNRENGVLVPPRDIEALAEAMAAMRDNADSYDRIWIREDCISRFGEQAVVGRLSEIYGEICSEGRLK